MHARREEASVDGGGGFLCGCAPTPAVRAAAGGGARQTAERASEQDCREQRRESGNPNLGFWACVAH